MGAPVSPHTLLTAHFLRQFLENDLVSPDSDRSQLLAMVTAAIVCLTLFLGMMMSAGYVIAPLMTPGLAAVLSLGDKYFFIGFGMILTALVAASQWDALAVDARDAAILEPLPVPASVVRRAKLAAVALLGVAAAVLVNLCPSVLLPALLLYKFQQASVLALAQLVTTHAIVTVAAAAFGYLTVITLREVLLAVLGGRGFTRVSPWVQGALIVVLGGSLLLLPLASSRIAPRGFDDWRMMSPPMWFLGVYEVMAGDVLVELPRRAMHARQAANDAVATSLYRSRQQQFPTLALRAAAAVGMVWVLSASAYAWNARRRPLLGAAAPPARRRRWTFAHRPLNRWLRAAGARAGFYFALAAMWRSNTHRLTFACAGAVGVAMVVVASARLARGGAGVSPLLLSIQPLLYGALLVGFRHAIRVPAELRANWGFQLAWRDERRAFVGGVKTAAVAALVAPALLAVLPVYVMTLGTQPAMLHALLGLAGAVLFLEALMVGYDKVPFTCTYLPSDNMKALAPLYAIAFLIGASLFARLQYEALVRGNGLAALVVLGAAIVALRVIAARRRPAGPMDFDEAPTSLQRLGLDA